MRAKRARPAIGPVAATDGEAAKRSERPSWARVETRGGIQPGLKLTKGK